MRELKEETGFHVKAIQHVTPPLVSDAGLSNSLIHLGIAHVDGDALENKVPVAELDDGEDIEVVEVPLRSLHECLKKYERDGLLIDSRLWFFAEGMSLSHSLMRTPSCL